MIMCKERFFSYDIQLFPLFEDVLQAFIIGAIVVTKEADYLTSTLSKKHASLLVLS